MLLITESAKGMLKTALDNAEAEPGQCLRIKAVPGDQFAISLDAETEGDQVVEHGGTKVVVFDNETAKDLDGLVLDYRDSGEGPQLTLLRVEEPKGGK